MRARPAARRSFQPTAQGGTVLGAATALFVAGRLVGAPELCVLAIAGAALVALAAVWVARQHPEMSATRDVQPTRLHVGGDGRVDLVVGNHAPRTTSLITVTDVFGDGQRAARFLVPPLLPGQVARAAYRIPTSRRGRHPIGPLSVTLADPFGLVRRTWTLGTGDQVIVCPRVHDILAPPDLTGPRAATAESLRAHSPAPDGDEFLALRDYEIGDDLRKVHWRSTARTGELMVRQDEARREPRTRILLDTRAKAHDRASFEVAVEAVASIVARLARSGRQLEVVTAAGESLSRRGSGHEALLMDRLAVLEPGGPDRLLATASALRAASRPALIIVVTGSLGDATAAGLARLDVGAGPAVLVTTRPGHTEIPRGGGRSAVIVVDASRAPFAAAWDEVTIRWKEQHDAERSRHARRALIPTGEGKWS
jgi:uncharacterized protein (DUF58 family)